MQNSQWNNCKPNPKEHVIPHATWSSKLHSRMAGIVQNIKISQCNIPYKGTERKTW